MDCRGVPEAMADLLGGEASRETEALLLAHLAACGGCARAHEGLPALIQKARAVLVPEPPPAYWTSFHHDLRRRIDQDRARGWRWDGFLAWFRPLVAASALAALTFFLVRSSSQGVPPAPAEAPDAARVAALVRAIDALATDDPLPASDWSSREETSEMAEALRSEPSSDVFSFFDSTLPLSEDETRSLLAGLTSEFPG